MKKIPILILAIFSLSLTTNKGNIYLATGSIHFTSDAPLELIKASSEKMIGALNTENNEFFFKVNMKSFNGFNSALQREHFNENYLETFKYPKTTFKGRIIEDIDFSVPGKYKIRAKGKLYIHGIEQNRIIKCILEIKKNEFIVKSDFTVFLNEHNIKIPNIVSQKIAKEINVKIKAKLKPRNK